MNENPQQRRGRYLQNTMHAVLWATLILFAITMLLGLIAPIFIRA